MSLPDVYLDPNGGRIGDPPVRRDGSEATSRSLTTEAQPMEEAPRETWSRAGTDGVDLPVGALLSASSGGERLFPS